jgi:hypothetical protein
MSATNQGLTRLTELLGTPQDVSDIITRELGTVERWALRQTRASATQPPAVQPPDATGLRAPRPTFAGRTDPSHAAELALRQLFQLFHGGSLAAVDATVHVVEAFATVNEPIARWPRCPTR